MYFLGTLLGTECIVRHTCQAFSQKSQAYCSLKGLSELTDFSCFLCSKVQMHQSCTNTPQRTMVHYGAPWCTMVRGCIWRCYLHHRHPSTAPPPSLHPTHRSPLLPTPPLSSSLLHSPLLSNYLLLLASAPATCYMLLNLKLT